MSNEPTTKEQVSVGVWKFDPMHTQVEFSAKHLGMMTVRGHFNEVVAEGKIDPDLLDVFIAKRVYELTAPR